MLSPNPHALSNLLESLRSCFISSIGLVGSWQGSGVFSNGTESEYSTASIRRGAYGPPLLSLDPRAPGAECHGASPSPYPCGLLLPCLNSAFCAALQGPLQRQGSYMSWPLLKGMVSKLWPPRNISRSQSRISPLRSRRKSRRRWLVVLIKARLWSGRLLD